MYIAIPNNPYVLVAPNKHPTTNPMIYFTQYKMFNKTSYKEVLLWKIWRLYFFWITVGSKSNR